MEQEHCPICGAEKGKQPHSDKCNYSNMKQQIDKGEIIYTEVSTKDELPKEGNSYWTSNGELNYYAENNVWEFPSSDKVAPVPKWWAKCIPLSSLLSEKDTEIDQLKLSVTALRYEMNKLKSQISQPAGDMPSEEEFDVWIDENVIQMSDGKIKIYKRARITDWLKSLKATAPSTESKEAVESCKKCKGLGWVPNGVFMGNRPCECIEK